MNLFLKPGRTSYCKDMKILITGGSGFIGKTLIGTLLNYGHQLTIFARDKEKIDSAMISKIRVIEGNFNDRKALEEALKDNKVVINLVGSWQTWGKSPSEIDKINVEPLQKMIDILVQNRRHSVKHIIFLSSVHVYDFENHKLITEEDSTKPWNEYSRSKLLAEKILRESKIQFTIVRSGIVYGPGDYKGFISNLINQLKRRLVIIPGNGRNLIHLIYIDDLIAGIVKIIEKLPKNETYNLVGPEPTPLDDLIEKVKEFLDLSVLKINIPLPLAKIMASFFESVSSRNEPMLTKDRLKIISASRSFSWEKAKADLTFKPNFSYEEGLKKTLSWLSSQEISANKILEIPIDGIVDAARKFQTPFFIFSESVLENRFRLFKKSVSQYYPNLIIYYSAKTNFEPAVLNTLKNNDAGIEIACGHELAAAKKAGFAASHICFDGPVKTEEDLRFAIGEGINIFNMDSLEEAEKIDKIAGEMGKKIKVGFRINLGLKGFLKGPTEFYITKFGIDLDNLIPFYRKLRQFSNLIVWGIHTHIGSQVINPDLYKAAIRQLVAAVKKLESEGLIIREINVGGGIPSSGLLKTTMLDLAFSFLRLPRLFFGNSIRKKPLPLEIFGEIIGRTFFKEVKNLSFKPRLALEPGRSLTGPMGILISKVSHIKKSWVFLDASTYSVPESIFFAKRRFIVPEKIYAKPKKKYNLAGASLNTADVFALDELLPELEVGDIIGILDAGAYSISRAAQFTVLNPPIYYLTNQNELKLVRRRGRYEDLTSQNV